MARILPTHYFHVVFTLPAELRGVARACPRVVFNVLFAAASETLLELGHDTKWLGAELGVTCVLHTWTRELMFHPHLHCIVTGGGLTDDGLAWRATPRKFLLPVRVMGTLFRGKVLSKLRAAAHAGHLGTHATSLAAFDRLFATNWVVYAKRPFGGAEQVMRYLGRYTHRIGISNHRLVTFEQGQVTFHTKNGQRKTLDADEFLARFVAHVLPHGFVKIRHYGLQSPRHATTRLEVARQRLQPSRPPPSPTSAPSGEVLDWRALLHELTGIDLRRCPACAALAVVRRPLEPLARAPPVAV
jgi:hypothetical protein